MAFIHFWNSYIINRNVFQGLALRNPFEFFSIVLANQLLPDFPNINQGSKFGISPKYLTQKINTYKTEGFAFRINFCNSVSYSKLHHNLIPLKSSKTLGKKHQNNNNLTSFSFCCYLHRLVFCMFAFSHTIFYKKLEGQLFFK